MAKPRPDEERKLYVTLTDDELLMKGDRQSDRIKQLVDIKLRKDAFNAAIKLEADAASTDAERLADEIKHKRELRPVRCVWRITGERWECWRADTGEVIDTAPITMADRQQELLS